MVMTIVPRGQTNSNVFFLICLQLCKKVRTQQEVGGKAAMVSCYCTLERFALLPHPLSFIQNKKSFVNESRRCECAVDI